MLRFIRERVRGRHKKLLHDYIAIFFIMGTVLFLSFFVIGYIADSTAMGQSRGASRVIYKQAREQMEQFEEDLANMQMNVVKDESVLCFWRRRMFMRGCWRWSVCRDGGDEPED